MKHWRILRTRFGRNFSKIVGSKEWIGTMIDRYTRPGNWYAIWTDENRYIRQCLRSWIWRIKLGQKLARFLKDVKKSEKCIHLMLQLLVSWQNTSLMFAFTRAVSVTLGESVKMGNFSRLTQSQDVCGILLIGFYCQRNYIFWRFYHNIMEICWSQSKILNILSWWDRTHRVIGRTYYVLIISVVVYLKWNAHWPVLDMQHRVCRSGKYQWGPVKVLAIFHHCWRILLCGIFWGIPAARDSTSFNHVIKCRICFAWHYATSSLWKICTQNSWSYKNQKPRE